ncbi:MAG: NAD(P)-dependent oxidoreductase [Minisyncoccia bacterium]
MKILITGATGFVGKNLIKKAKKRGYILYALVRPSTNKDFLIKENIKYHVLDKNIENFISFMQNEKIDGVIHLASLFLTQHNPEDVKNLIDSNVYLGSLVLEASVRGNVKWFINTGTFWQHYRGKDYSPINLYSATKQAFEDIAKYYAESSNINFVTIKLNDTFGPNDSRPKLLNVWDKISRSGEVLDMSPGKQILDITHVENVVSAFLQMIMLLSTDKQRKFSGKSYVVKSPKRMSLKKLAHLFEKITGRTLNIRWGKKTYRERENMNPWNNGKVIPGWKPSITLEEGIKKTYK